MIPYADPVVVLVLVVLSLPIPYVIIMAGLRELLLGAPDAGFQHQLRRHLGPVFADRGYKACGLRIADCAWPKQVVWSTSTFLCYLVMSRQTRL